MRPSHKDFTHPSDILRVRRKELQLTQTDLAKLLGYHHPNFISLLEAGKAGVPLRRLVPMSMLLQIDPVWFFERVLRARDNGDTDGGYNVLCDTIFDLDRLQAYIDYRRGKRGES